MEFTQKTKCFITVPYGSVTFVFKDIKMIKSKKIEIRASKPELLIIPKNIWFKFWTKKNTQL